MKIDGKKITMARTEKGWSKSDLQRLSGVSRNTILNMENSKHARASKVGKIAECLGKPVEFFEVDCTELPKNTDELIRDVLKKCKIAKQEYGDGSDYTSGKWLTILVEEVGEISQAMQIDEPWSKETDKSNLYGEITDAAAVLIRWAENLKP